MMFATISTPVLLILAAVIGLLIGLLISSLFNREPKTGAENPLPEKFQKAGYAEGASLYYSPAAKKIITSLDGDFYTEFLSLTPEQKKRILRLVQLFDEWSGQVKEQPGIPNNFQTLNPPITTNLQPKPINPTTLPISLPPLPEVSPFEEIKTNPELAAVFDIDKPVEPIPAVIKFGGNKKNPAPEKPLTIVEQINKVLDRIVAGTPNENKSIKLVENGPAGVVVWIGLEHYDGIDNVPDPVVKQLIKSAVTKWEEETEQRNKKELKK